MDFSWVLFAQISQSIGMHIEVTTDTVLFEGRLIKFEYDVLELEETVVGYERESRPISIPLSSINFIRVHF